MTNSYTLPIKSQLYNVQPTSHTSKPRVFPSLPYTTKNLKFIKKCNFEFSDLTNTEYLHFVTCYSNTKLAMQHKNDVGKIANPFRIRLKPKAQLITQRPSKVPIHYRDKINTLLKELEKHNMIKQFSSSPQDKPNKFMAQLI